MIQMDQNNLPYKLCSSMNEATTAGLKRYSSRLLIKINLNLSTAVFLASLLTYANNIHIFKSNY
jgi:hypothetical protein